MTAKREAELETENRMLREQVASLEKIIEQATRPQVHLDTAGAAAQPWWYYGNYHWTYPNVVTVGGPFAAGTDTTSILGS